ncbi:hypothetical protein [Nonomuraea sp. GTA35]|uniref:hypothetical protein n=1 Tax=Nonomuraea sp. GTA35 TaxID=1676746 RepID=UPI0035C1BEE1
MNEAPEHVRRTWPSVVNWTWLSPLRLSGADSMNEGRTVHLVVVDPHTDQHAMGQAIPADRATEVAYVAEVFARLRLKLGEDIALRMACEDGTPVRAEHDRSKCRWCGAHWNEHTGNGTPQPRYPDDGRSPADDVRDGLAMPWVVDELGGANEIG